MTAAYTVTVTGKGGQVSSESGTFKPLANPQWTLN